MDTGRHCAICGRNIRRSVLCTSCQKKWCSTIDGKLFYPDWVKALIKIENHNYYTNRFAKEIPLDDGLF